MTTTKNEDRPRKSYRLGSYAKKPTPSAAKLKEREEAKALEAKVPPEPKNLKEALAQCVEANRACREDNKRLTSNHRSPVSMFLTARWRETVDNLFNIIDPDPEDED
jgi:hypothetical protein